MACNQLLPARGFSKEQGNPRLAGYCNDRYDERKALGELLVRAGFIDAEGLSRARAAQEKEAISLGKALARMGLGNEDDMVAAIARSLKLESLGGELPEVSPEVAALLLLSFAGSEWWCLWRCLEGSCAWL